MTRQLIIYNSYDSLSSFPQECALGLGVIHEDGSHTPPPGLSSHDVTDELVHGIDEEFYTTTAAGTLTPKSQADVDAIVAARNAEKQVIRDARIEVQSNIILAKGSAGGLVETNVRIDELVTLLQDLGYVPK